MAETWYSPVQLLWWQQAEGTITDTHLFPGWSQWQTFSQSFYTVHASIVSVFKRPKKGVLMMWYSDQRKRSFQIQMEMTPGKTEDCNHHYYFGLSYEIKHQQRVYWETHQSGLTAPKLHDVVQSLIPRQQQSVPIFCSLANAQVL